jgi:hypothetical protein
MTRAPVFRMGSVLLFETLLSGCSAFTGIPKSTIRLQSAWHVRSQVSSVHPKSAGNVVMKEGAAQQPLLQNDLCSTIHKIGEASQKFGEASVKVGSAATVLAESSRETSKAATKFAEAGVDGSKAVTKIGDATSAIGLCLQSILYAALGNFIASTLQPIPKFVLFCATLIPALVPFFVLVLVRVVPFLVQVLSFL